MRLRFVCFLVFAAFFHVVSASPGLADELPGFWQSQRERINVIGDRACAGSLADFQVVEALATKENNPVAMHEMAWVLVKSHCHHFGRSRHEAHMLVERAAKRSYPISQFYYGRAILLLAAGNPDEQQKGLCWIYRGVEGGYETGAAYLSRHHMLSNLVPFDPARSLGFYKIAKAAGVEHEDMAFLKAAFGSVFPDETENREFLSERLAECDTNLW